MAGSESVCIRVTPDIRDWLTDHKDSKRKSISAVLEELIEFWEVE